jgi:hypothetical protein
MTDVPPRLLRETLRDQPAPNPTASACLDAETMAAWCDDTLSKRDRTTAESHLSTCVRCQAVLAATVRTAAPLAPRRWWQTPAVRWFVPIAVTSAAALVLWVKTPDQRQSFQPARSEPPAPVVNTPNPTAPNLKAVPPVAESAPRLPAAGLNRRADSKDGKERAAREEARQEQPTPARALERDDVAAAPTAVPEPSRPEAPSSAASPLVDSLRVATSQAAKAVVVAPPGIVSPNRNSRWRILPGGGVERSTDGGATWQTQSTGASATLTAGAAPGPTICWLVGPAGIVVLSTDGRTWQRVTFPEAVDLVSIRASDAANATVTAADGRSFTTSDRGRTWHLP